MAQTMILSWFPMATSFYYITGPAHYYDGEAMSWFAKKKPSRRIGKALVIRGLISPLRAGVGTGRPACAGPVAEASSGLFPQPLWMRNIMTKIGSLRQRQYIRIRMFVNPVRELRLLTGALYNIIHRLCRWFSLTGSRGLKITAWGLFRIFERDDLDECFDDRGIQLGTLHPLQLGLGLDFVLGPAVGPHRTHGIV